MQNGIPALWNERVAQKSIPLIHTSFFRVLRQHSRHRPDLRVLETSDAGRRHGSNGRRNRWRRWGKILVEARHDLPTHEPISLGIEVAPILAQRKELHRIAG